MTQESQVQHESWLDSTTTIQLQQEPEEKIEPEIKEIGRKAWTTASRVARMMSKESRIVNPSMEKGIARFRKEEIEVGKLLGNGGFSKVYEVKALNLMKNGTGDYQQKIRSPLQKEIRAHVAEHVWREQSSETRYACKFLSKSIMDNENRFRTGAADLVASQVLGISLSSPHHQVAWNGSSRYIRICHLQRNGILSNFG